MIDNIHVDLKEHENKVQQALNILENQTYIQRNGDVYEFLTDDEKDIEQEIKSTEIDDQKITELFKMILFDEIIRDNRIRFNDNKQDYDFTSKIDGSILGREKELTVEIITPNFRDHDREDFFKAQTMGYSTLLMMVLPNDDHMMMDIRMYLKTDKYIKQTQSVTTKDNIKRILYEKAQQNTARRGAMVVLLRRLLGEADVYMNGMKQEMVSSSDGKNKLINAFQNLVRLAYPNLKMLGSAIYMEDSIKSIMKNTQDDLFGSDDKTMSEAESEVFNIVHRRKKQSERTSLSDLREFFSRRPYGWYQNAIWCIAARLYKRGMIEMRQDSNLLDDDDALNAFLNNRFYNNTLLEPQVDIDPRQVKALREVYSDFFDESCPAKEAKDVATTFKNKLKEDLVALNQMLASKQNYPFLSELEPVENLLDRLTRKEYSYFLTNLNAFEDELLDYKEKTLDPIKRFWNGEQKKIYDSIQIFFSGNQSNLDYIESKELEPLIQVAEHKKPYEGSIIKDAKAARDRLSIKILEQIEQEKELTKKDIESVITSFESMQEFQSLDYGEKEMVLKPFKDEQHKLKDQRFIANLKETRIKVKGKILEDQLNLMMQLSKPEVPPDGPEEPEVHYMRMSNVKVNFEKTELRTREDVDNYIKAMKKALMDKIENNNRIKL